MKAKFKFKTNKKDISITVNTGNKIDTMYHLVTLKETEIAEIIEKAREKAKKIAEQNKCIVLYLKGIEDVE